MKCPGRAPYYPEFYHQMIDLVRSCRGSEALARACVNEQLANLTLCATQLSPPAPSRPPQRIKPHSDPAKRVSASCLAVGAVDVLFTRFTATASGVVAPLPKVVVRQLAV